MDGVRIGSLVEVNDDADRGGPEGSLGQVLDYVDEKNEFIVALVRNGEVLHVDSKFVRSAENLHKPGKGGGPESFDTVLGPRTEDKVFGEEVGHCLLEKGFCVTRVINEDGLALLLKDYNALRDEDSAGRLHRLGFWLEYFYHGEDGRAKVMWMSPENDYNSKYAGLSKMDDLITNVSMFIHPPVQDMSGSEVAERTDALVCLTLKEDDDSQPSEVTEEELYDCYRTWKRSLLRILFFVGPGEGTVILRTRENVQLSNLESEYEISGCPNTLLFIREDMYRFQYCEPLDAGSCWLQVFHMMPSTYVDLDTIEVKGDGLEELISSNRVREGPQPPSDNQVAVVAAAIHTASNITNCAEELMAYIAGVDGQLEMPIERFSYSEYYSPEVLPNKTYVKHFSVQFNCDLFDNGYFNISVSEARAIDPMYRQVLEVGAECVTEIGLTRKLCTLNPPHAGISVGNDKTEWVHMSDVPHNVAANNQLAIAANRFSYAFNLKGPSFVIDTACSSSLVGAHTGKALLQNSAQDPISWHLAMGTGMTLSILSFIGSCEAGMLSASGRCLTFDATANGYNRGDGTAGIIMKVGEHSDTRIAFYRGSETGQDGRSASMSAPNGPSQEKCVWGALRQAKMTPPESTVWECHGTGTALGDPIEVGAVQRVQSRMTRQNPLMIATSKSNIGHLEGAAAIIAIVKCLQVCSKTLSLPTIHLRRVNPHLDHTQFDALFCTEPCVFPYLEGHCQVSSFGVGGTNGHAIFWGEKENNQPIDLRSYAIQKLKNIVPTITHYGCHDPVDWYCDDPSENLKGNVRYHLKVEKRGQFQEPIITYEEDCDEEEDGDDEEQQRVPV